MAETTSSADGWISLSEAAATTGYAVSTLQRLVRLRKLIARKRRQKWFVEQAALSHYIKSSTPGRKPVEPTPLPQQGLTLWFPKVFSKSPLGLDALINGIQYHFVYLRLEYPHGPDDQVANLAPGMPGFYSISARASISAILWLEQQFVTGTLHIEILKRDFPVVHYSEPVDSVCETVSEGSTGYVSAAFGFYKAELKPATHTAVGSATQSNPQRLFPAGEWLTMDEAGQRAGCSLAELRELAQEGKITAMKRYGHWQINANSLQSHLQDRLVPQSPEM